VAEAASRLASLPTKLLVCTPIVPPNESGHAVVLGRMLRDIDPADYDLVTFSPARTDVPPDLPRLAAKVHHLPSAWRQGSASGPRASLRSNRRFSAEAVRRGRQLAALIRREGFGALLVTSSGGPDQPAGVLAARLAGVPLIVYMLDEWQHLVSQDRSLTRLAALLQRLVMKRAAGVIVANPWLGATLDRRYGSHCAVAANPVAPAFLADPPAPDSTWPAVPGSVRLVFTGQVYPANLDAIERVIAAIAEPGLEAVSLHLYSSSAMAVEVAASHPGRVVAHAYVPEREIRAIQRGADILLMPLAFESPFPEIIRTAAPTKFGEYLASGRPMLVHAPVDSFPAVLASTEDLAEVVGVPDHAPIATAIRTIMDDHTRREERQLRCLGAAVRHYGPEATTERFAAILQGLLAAHEPPATA
jgi:glycosyltransferase involved in cell wall biosynthesis